MIIGTMHRWIRVSATQHRLVSDEGNVCCVDVVGTKLHDGDTEPIYRLTGPTFMARDYRSLDEAKAAGDRYLDSWSE